MGLEPAQRRGKKSSITSYLLDFTIYWSVRTERIKPAVVSSLLLDYQVYYKPITANVTASAVVSKSQVYYKPITANVTASAVASKSPCAVDRVFRFDSLQLVLEVNASIYKPTAGVGSQRIDL